MSTMRTFWGLLERPSGASPDSSGGTADQAGPEDTSQNDGKPLADDQSQTSDQPLGNDQSQADDQPQTSDQAQKDDQSQTGDQPQGDDEAEDPSQIQTDDPASAQSQAISDGDHGDSTAEDDDGPQELVESAQAGDIESALRSAGLWEKSNEIAPLLNTAKVPASAKVFTTIRVDKNLNVQIRVTTDPPDKSGATLAGLLTQKYSAAMKAALQKAKLKVADTIDAKWVKF